MGYASPTQAYGYVANDNVLLYDAGPYDTTAGSYTLMKTWTQFERIRGDSQLRIVYTYTLILGGATSYVQLRWYDGISETTLKTDSKAGGGETITTDINPDWVVNGELRLYAYNDSGGANTTRIEDLYIKGERGPFTQ